MSAKRTPLPRQRRSGLAALVALIVLAAGVLGTVAAIQIFLDHGRTALGDVSYVAERLRTRDWTDIGVLIAGIAFAVVGLWLLLAGLFPARRPFVRLVDPDPQTLSGVTRTGLGRDLAAVAARVDGVASARAKVGRSRVRVRVRSALRDTSGLQQAVDTAVHERVDSLHPMKPLTVSTRVRAGGN